MWEETLVFTVHMPEIALVRFLVWDHDPLGVTSSAKDAGLQQHDARCAGGQ